MSWLLDSNEYEWQTNCYSCYLCPTFVSNIIVIITVVIRVISVISLVDNNWCDSETNKISIKCWANCRTTVLSAQTRCYTYRWHRFTNFSVRVSHISSRWWSECSVLRRWLAVCLKWLSVAHSDCTPTALHRTAALFRDSSLLWLNDVIKWLWNFLFKQRRLSRTEPVNNWMTWM